MTQASPRAQPGGAARNGHVAPNLGDPFMDASITLGRSKIAVEKL